MSITGHICHLCCREFDSSMALYMHHCVPHGDYPTQDCALCNGRGVYGIPGERCTFCHGTGKVRKPPAPVEREESSADPHGVPVRVGEHNGGDYDTRHKIGPGNEIYQLCGLRDREAIAANLVRFGVLDKHHARRVADALLDADGMNAPATKLDNFIQMVRIWVERDGGNMEEAIAWMYADRDGVKTPDGEQQ